jgi:hypothetical protein
MKTLWAGAQILKLEKIVQMAGAYYPFCQQRALSGNGLFIAKMGFSVQTGSQ